MQTTLDRRDFTKETLASLVTFSLLETLFAGDSFAKEVKPVAAQWLAQLNQMGLDLKGKKLQQVQWQKQVEVLFQEIDLPELLRFIDFEKLTKDLKHKERGEKSLRMKFPEVEGLPTKLVFGSQLFALKKGRSVAPHGHNNMTTAFLILDGQFHGRHYDRLEDEKEHIIIKPTIDRQFGRAEFSTISDYKDNVHWFKTTSEAGFIFNIHVLSVKPGRTGRVYIDPDGEELAGGKIRARKIKTDEAYRLFG